MRNLFKKLLDSLIRKSLEHRFRKNYVHISYMKKRIIHKNENPENRESRIKLEKIICYKIFNECMDEIRCTAMFIKECKKSSKYITNNTGISKGYIPNIVISIHNNTIKVIDDYDIITTNYKWILYWLVEKYKERQVNSMGFPVIDFSFKDADKGYLIINDWAN